MKTLIQFNILLLSNPFGNGWIIISPRCMASIYWRGIVGLRNHDGLTKGLCAGIEGETRINVLTRENILTTILRTE